MEFVDEMAACSWGKPIFRACCGTLNFHVLSSKMRLFPEAIKMSSELSLFGFLSHSKKLR